MNMYEYMFGITLGLVFGVALAFFVFLTIADKTRNQGDCLPNEIFVPTTLRTTICTANTMQDVVNGDVRCHN